MSSNADRPKQPRDFDPVSFAVVPPRKFEDLRVGDVFRVPSRTLTDAHAAVRFSRRGVTLAPIRSHLANALGPRKG